MIAFALAMLFFFLNVSFVAKIALGNNGMGITANYRNALSPTPEWKYSNLVGFYPRSGLFHLEKMKFHF